ncbi:auxin-responsive protein IAA31-like [Bidens hawaiensis]|uniref:auxin-responsive protein IAA31-like n=1 Tax=Bidens hawaiensis TaxID=980011 RepID=UPI00404B76BD
MELELSLSPPNQTRHTNKKNRHANNHGCPTVSTFPLVSWNHDEDDEQHNTFLANDHQRDLDDDEEEGLAGWPPLHSWRKRLMEENHHERVDQINVMNNNDELFVKVKMDGVAIARKIDLNAFNSYQMLTTALIHMFDKSVEIEEDIASYRLMYQHRDGHWHLGGDLPWDLFIRSVKRIHMVRN